jgi:hypothetical protein
MAHLLNTSSQIQCPHGGMVQISSTNAKAKGGGAFLVRSSDTFTVSGCPFMIGNTPHPCVTLQWLTTATKVKADGQSALTKDSSALCKAADQAPQGNAIINSTQTKVAGS